MTCAPFFKNLTTNRRRNPILKVRRYACVVFVVRFFVKRGPVTDAESGNKRG